MLGCEILYFTPQHLTLSQKNNTNSDFVSVFVLFPCVNDEQKGASFQAENIVGIHGDLNPKHIKTWRRAAENY